MYKINLTNFRCFAELPRPLEVLPITFLVGENSSGKTTFLAGLRQLINGFAEATSGNPFNSDPYFLGGFDQIAHYRGGKPGRAKQFSLEVTIPTGGENRPSTSHKYTFEKGTVKPELSEYVFDSPEAKLTLDLANKFSVLKIEPKDGSVSFRNSEEKGAPPSALLRNSVGVLRYIFESTFLRADYIQAKERQAELVALMKNLQKRYKQSIDYTIRTTFATAPVRTQPLRTYTPSEIDASSEGAHVPLEMARSKFNPEEWRGVHDDLSQFGRHSGLFDDINIRRLGKNDGDPFQVLVRTNGPAFNLVDVGYGVSQALPIIYQLQHGKPRDAFLLQQPEVHLHPRAQAELGTLVAQLSKKRPNSLYAIETHSDYIIDRVRTEIAKGALNHKAVTILFFQKGRHGLEAFNIYLSEKGEILDPPDNFRSFFLEEHARLLGI